MSLSQSASIAASIAIERDVSVQEVAYPELLEKLLAAKQIARLSDISEKATNGAK
jgi:hypothetical protein